MNNMRDLKGAISSRRNAQGQYELATGEDETAYALSVFIVAFLAGKLVGYDTNFAGKAATMAGTASFLTRFVLKDKIVVKRRTQN